MTPNTCNKIIRGIARKNVGVLGVFLCILGFYNRNRFIWGDLNKEKSLSTPMTIIIICILLNPIDPNYSHQW